MQGREVLAGILMALGLAIAGLYLFWNVEGGGSTAADVVAIGGGFSLLVLGASYFLFRPASTQ